MKTQITYNNYGQTYTETFTPEQARKELLDFGYPDAKFLTDAECLRFIHKIFS